MGDVISLTRVSDVDIFSQFDAQCPAIPSEIDLRIPRSAKKAIDRVEPENVNHNFRNHCIFVVVMSLLVLMAVKMASNNIAQQFGLVRADSESASTEYRNNRSSWLTHIATLEQHPIYQRIVEERRLFSQRYESQP